MFQDAFYRRFNARHGTRTVTRVNLVSDNRRAYISFLLDSAMENVFTRINLTIARRQRSFATNAGMYFFVRRLTNLVSFSIRVSSRNTNLEYLAINIWRQNTIEFRNGSRRKITVKVIYFRSQVSSQSSNSGKDKRRLSDRDSRVKIARLGFSSLFVRDSTLQD